MTRPTHLYENHRGKIKPEQLATGTPDGTKFLRDDQVWAVPPGGGGDLDDLGDVVVTSPVVAQRLRYDGSVWRNSSMIFRPLMAQDPTTGQFHVVTDVDGSAIMVEG
jgi:hypothetical protein